MILDLKPHWTVQDNDLALVVVFRCADMRNVISMNFWFFFKLRFESVQQGEKNNKYFLFIETDALQKHCIKQVYS